ncbi:cobalamin-dependent protein [Candidatus Fermentibacteria bacterium]|nr:cobalamin-dependent protein [Candidatus Fermentibacteria bacterium]
MKCLLTSPSWRTEDIRSVQTRAVSGVWPMPGVLSVGAALRQAGHDVRILDGHFHTEAQLLGEIEAWKPDLLGVYSVTLMWNRATELFRRVKRLDPKTFTVAGGPAPTGFMSRCLDEPALDAVVYGEGDLTVVELAARVASGADLDGVQGCVWRDGDLIVQNPPRAPIPDLDALPMPAYDLVAHYSYRPSYGQVKRLPAMQVISSRGCASRCIFCFKTINGATRYRSPGHVVDEIESYVRRHGAREIKFWDEQFMLNRERAMGICEEILRRNLKIVFWCTGRVDTVDEELLRMMKRAGCWCISYGLESGVEKNLATLNKRTTVEQGREAVCLTHRAGIESMGTYVFGIPGETYEEGQETIRFACSMNHFYVEFFPLTPFPGTKLYDEIDRYGRLNAPQERLGMLFKAAPFVAPTMTEEQIVDLVERGYARYYARPSYVLRRIAGIRGWYDVQVMFHGALSVATMGFSRLRHSIR